MLAYKLQKANLCKVNYRNEGKTINTQEWCTTTGTGGPGPPRDVCKLESGDNI